MRRTLHYDSAGLEHIAVVGKLQCQPGVLFHQENCDAEIGVDFLDALKNRLHQNRCNAERRLVEQAAAAACSSAPARWRASVVLRRIASRPPASIGRGGSGGKYRTHTRDRRGKFFLSSPQVRAHVKVSFISVSPGKIMRPSGTWHTPRFTMACGGLLGRCRAPSNRIFPRRGLHDAGDGAERGLLLPAPFAPMSVTMEDFSPPSARGSASAATGVIHGTLTCSSFRYRFTNPAPRRYALRSTRRVGADLFWRSLGNLLAVIQVRISVCTSPSTHSHIVIDEEDCNVSVLLADFGDELQSGPPFRWGSAPLRARPEAIIPAWLQARGPSRAAAV